MAMENIPLSSVQFEPGKIYIMDVLFAMLVYVIGLRSRNGFRVYVVDIKKSFKSVS